MKDYVLDTNILIHIVRDSKVWKKINDSYDPFRNVSHVSFAAVAEAFSFAKRMDWSDKKINSLKSVVRSFDVLHSDDGLIEYYIEIDVFSQGKHPLYNSPKVCPPEIWAKTIFGLQLRPNLLKVQN